MSENSPFLTLDQDCDEAVTWVTDRVRQAGLTLIRTFNLQVARQAQVACPCPHHGTDECDCQMVVLMIYGVEAQPLALIAHGFNGQTWFTIVDIPQQRVDPHLEAMLLHLFASAPSAPTRFENQAHAL